MANHFNMLQIINNGGNSCEIIYLKLFEKMGLKKENLWSYEGLNLEAFNDSTTRLWRYIELMIYVGG